MSTQSKHYDVLFIGETPPGGDLKQEGIKSFLSDILGHTVHYSNRYLKTTGPGSEISLNNERSGRCRKSWVRSWGQTP